MKSKNEDSYIQIFKHIINLLQRVQVEFIVLDFELAILNAIRIVLPKTMVYFAFFTLKKLFIGKFKDFVFKNCILLM
jgi:hypothetical protein